MFVPRLFLIVVAVAVVVTAIVVAVVMILMVDAVIDVCVLDTIDTAAVDVLVPACYCCHHSCFCWWY